MNENLNLVEILKDCPKGTKLYSSVLGEVELEGVTDSVNYPIIVKLNEEQFGARIIETFTSDGRLIATYEGECVLFPSRDQRDWSKFKHTCEFKDGDILSYQTVRFATEEEKQKLFQAIKDNRYKWNAETKTLEKLVEPKFDPKTLRPFDKVLVKDDGDWIWRVDIISVPADYNDNIPYLIGDNDFDWIIPYNEETKHLVGTHEEAPEYYRYWED